MKTKRTFIKLLAGVCLAAAFICCFALAASAQESAVGEAYDRLEAPERAVYLYLHEQIEAVANGQLASAVFVADSTRLAEWERAGLQIKWTNSELGVDSITDTAVVSERFWEQLSLSDMMTALMHDCPYELYWYDKTVGVLSSVSMSMRGTGSTYTEVQIKSVTFTLSVANTYRAQGYDAAAPMLDMQKTALAATAVQKAQAIVDRYASLSDYQKLKAYRDEICALVSYHDGAASGSYTEGYGDPWQLIWVFDGDPTTNVVCEGYAKAFQLLCDLSRFSGDVTCYSVSGTMSGGTGAGAHLWNIVTMEDGKSYLVDITNSDEGSIGHGGELFLAGVAGSIANGYRFPVGSASVMFLYDRDETVAFWGSGADSILALSSESYTPATVFISVTEALTYDGAPVDAGRNGTDIRYFYGGGEDLSDAYTFSHAFFADANGAIGAPLPSAPVNAGVYWITVTAKKGSETHTASLRFEIAKATPAYTLPQGLTAVYGQKLREVALPAGFAWQTEGVSVGDVGKHLFFLSFTPTDPNHATVSGLTVEVTVTPYDISKLAVTLAPSPVYTGKEQVQGFTLEAPDGMTVTYALSGERATDVGIYTLAIEGNGNFCGTVKCEWRLLPDDARLASLTTDNIKPSDRAYLEALRTSVKSDGAKQEWADMLAKCDALLQVLDAQNGGADAETGGAAGGNADTQTPNGSHFGSISSTGCSLTLWGGCAWLVFLGAAVLLKKRRN